MGYLDSYTIKQMANILGVHPDMLRKWEREGVLVPHKTGKGRKVYTQEHIDQAKEKNLVPDPAREARQRSEKYEKHTKEQLIEELENLKNEKRFGLVWDDSEEEEVVKRCKSEAPILARQAARRVFTDKNKPNNIFIEGDNYHALQMLNYTHKGKIDVIYIDPPYNTGASDWKYNNNYVDAQDRFRHSKWLNMMQHRLRLAKDLLNEEGFIACAIDHYELFYLGALMDDIFGEDNRLGVITVLHNPKGRNLSNFFSENSDFMLIYAKNIDAAEFNRIAISEDVKKTFSLIDEQGNYRLESFIRARSERSREKRPRFWYPLYVSPDMKRISADKIAEYSEVFPRTKTGEFSWKTMRETFIKNNVNNYFIAMREGGEITIKHKYHENEVLKNVWIDKRYQSEFNGTQLLKKILGDKVFDYPKSLYTLVDLIKITSREDSVILDFFAGSGTTGHAVLELNKEDGGNRKFILCTNNENHNGNGGGGIAESVCYPRIKKVMKGYKKIGNGNGEQIAGLGGNLEYFKTEFIDVENIQNVSDEKKLEFTHEAGQILALKEECFAEIERNKYYQIFTDGAEKYVGIYFREEIDKLLELDKKLLSKPEVRMYIFTYDGGGSNWARRYANYKNVSVEDIPEPILKVYKEVNL